MAYISIDELKNALNCYDLYPDDQLQQVIDTATAVLKPMLATQQYGVTHTFVDNGTIVIYTVRRHDLNIGDDVELTGSDYDETYTVTATTGFTIQAVTASTDKATTCYYKPMAVAAKTNAYTYDNVPAVRTAAMTIAVDVFNAWTVPGGQAQGIDFQPGPYLLGRSILQRVTGLISQYRDPAGIVG